MKDLVAIVGGVVGLIGGLVGLWSTYRPLKIAVSHLDYIGIVISANGTTWNVHLPVVFTNLAKVPGVITLIRLVIKPEGHEDIYQLDWGVFWKEDSELQRKIERTSAPIPIPGFTCVERSIQFNSDKQIKWEPRTYEVELQVRTDRNKSLKVKSKFYFRPSSGQVANWYRSESHSSNWVEDTPIYLNLSDIPNSENK
jgi:hypothetical protein